MGRLAHFEQSSMSPKQRATHAHLGEGKIILHVHNPEEEPSKPEEIAITTADWYKIMDATYWKKEETIKAGEGAGNLLEAETHIGYVILRFKKGRKTGEEEVSLFSLRHADARLRRRHR